MSTMPSGPLGKLALALSGGGYRAAAFHLGLLDTLSTVGLLDEVAALSTVSGGTILGAAYSLARVRGQAFPVFYREFYERLHERPLEQALQILVGSDARQLPVRTLIAAQAEVYDRIFFHRARFGEILQAATPLREIAFNATDFAAGLPFRFQKSSRPRVRIGNGRHAIPPQIAADLRVADIVAASSCFPAGFEPLAFPDDFHWRNLRELQRTLADDYEDRFRVPVPLMDGGVADNQGVDSLVAAVGRLEQDGPDAERVGLLIISDVNQPPSGPLLEAPVRPHRGLLRVRALFWCARLLFLAAVVSVLGLGWPLLGAIRAGTFRLWPDALTRGLPLALCALLAAGLAVARHLLRSRLLRRLPQAGVDVTDLLQRMPVRLLWDLVWMRAQSLIAMSSDVFMKSIRGLRYRELFDDEAYRQRTLTNLIYELAESHYKPRNGAPDWLRPTPEMNLIAERATNMPTALWFEYARQLPEVVACGRFTTCYTLLAHFVKRYGPDFAQAPDETRVICRRLQALWTRLQQQALQDPAEPLTTGPEPTEPWSAPA